MSKSILNQSSSLEKQTKVIEVGNFYLIHDGSKTGHPGLIIWRDEVKNLYLAIKFGTTSSKDNFKLQCALSNDITTSYCYKRLFLGKKKNFGSKQLTKLTISNHDLSALIKKFDFLNPTYSQDIHRKDKRFFKWAIKNPLYQGQLSSPKGSI